MAYGSPQARGRIRATAASLHHSYSSAGSKLHLQAMATPNPQPTERGQEWNSQPHGSKLDSFLLHHDVYFKNKTMFLASLSGSWILCCHELWCRSQMWLRSQVAIAMV